MRFRLLALLILFPASLVAQEEGSASDSILYNTHEEAPLFHVEMPPATLSAPLPYQPWDVWSLHEGVNARLSFGASTGFGKNAPKGVGLEERIDFAYAGKWNKRWVYAFMMSGNNTTWGPIRRRDISVTGIVGYRASERFSLYAYVSKSLLHNNGDWGGFSLGYYSPFDPPATDRVGVVAEWTFGENSWLQIAIEASRVKYNGPFPYYDYRTPFGMSPMTPYSW
mgnify:CR=1 FL=1